MAVRFIRVTVGKTADDTKYKILLYPKKWKQGARQYQNGKVVWKFYNYTTAKIWCKVTEFKKGGVGNSPFLAGQPTPNPVGVDAPQGNGNARHKDISGKIKGTALDVYTYEIHIGSMANNVALVNDPELRIDGVLLKPKKRKKATRRRKSKK